MAKGHTKFVSDARADATHRKRAVDHRSRPLLISALFFTWFFAACVWTVNALRRPVPPGRRFPPLWLPGMLISELAPLYFVARVLILVALGWLVRKLAAMLPRPRNPVFRLAIANLHRPGAQTGRLVVAVPPVALPRHHEPEGVPGRRGAASSPRGLTLPCSTSMCWEGGSRFSTSTTSASIADSDRNRSAL